MNSESSSRFWFHLHCKYVIFQADCLRRMHQESLQLKMGSRLISGPEAPEVEVPLVDDIRYLA